MYFITWCSPAALWLFHIPFHERIARMLSSPLICRLATDFFLYFHRVFRRLVHFTYFFTGCSPALWLFHIPFHRIIPFVETYFFYIFTGYFTGKFISHFLSSVLSVTHIIFICFSLFISHTIYVKYSVNRGSPFHIVFTSFSQLFSHTCGKSCEILCENCASVHMVFTCFFTG